ncbi:NAD(P)-dependent dehydrogenase (short-subunit alcohol dehydrogenase family) [Angulomicrobium tetraedrale]|uniref:NAD(P)-dependent dehydrogenase (Short-subunit alcohol dehydrogenase family) n=1 Tax=Ancylobacter tetraedralis TaxID=217068 RepID=A0A839ZAY0_9HYPH|nr:SDR family oxidoreductase [Ancylobacter tetraedralis]MBB3771887.1 NAD(P)-dependent dehydrogenase (short-subunit alcohol dehydrogenase family) [Ancylobacter tetraedralis]
MNDGAAPSPSLRPVALVTGGGIRIGRAICLTLATAGYDVVIHARHADEAAQTCLEAAMAVGARAAIVTGDLADSVAVAALMPAAAAALGPVSLLVNNASEFHPDGLGALDIARWDRHFAVNLRAPVFLAEAFAGQLPADRRGAIVNLIDQRVLKPTPAFLSYSLTKNALWAATGMMAQALAPRIRVNAVAPGPTLANLRQSADDFSRQSASVPLGRGPTPEEIADAVLFLARAESVTGQMIAVDGGQHLAWQTADALTPE